MTDKLRMPVMLLCPNLRCRKVLSVPEEVRGKTVKCQHCQTIVRVPEKSVPATAAATAKK
jgi:LSD1 subclass zinc finger protein